MIRVNVQDGNDQILVGADSATLALERAVTEAASAWLGGHITNPSNPPLDTSLLVSGAAADSKAAGDRIAATEAHHDEDMSYIEDADSYNLLDNRLVAVQSGQTSKLAVDVTRTGFRAYTLPGETLSYGRVWLYENLKPNTTYTLGCRKHKNDGGDSGVMAFRKVNGSWSTSGFTVIAGSEDDDTDLLGTFDTNDSGEVLLRFYVTFDTAGSGDVTWSDIMLLEGDYTGAYVQVPAFERRRHAEDDTARNLLDVAIASRDEIPAHAGTTADPAFDLDTLIQPGIYFKRVTTPVQHGVNDVNVKSNRRARIIVVSGGTNSLVMQFWQDFTYNELWMRTKYGGTDPWRTWTPLYTVKPNLTSNTDLNDLDYPGLYFKGSSVSVVNGVGDANRIAKILVIGHGSTALNTQFWFDYSSNMLWMRTKKYSGEWADWQQISNYENRYPGAPYSTVADMYTDLDAIESASEGRLTSEVISGVLDGDTSDATNVNRIRLYRLNVQPRYMVTGLNGGYKVVDPDNTEDWEAGTYNEYAQVKHNGFLWGSTSNSNTTEPGTSGAKWKPISPVFYQKPKAFLIAAQHGDERSNPRIMVDLIQKFLWEDSYAEIAAGFEWYIIPVVNVWGYNHNTRNNADDKNINRDYSKNKFETEEAQAVRDVYFANEFSLFLDIHNYNDNTVNQDNPRIGFVSLIPPVDTPSDADMAKFQRLWRTCDGVGRSAEAWARNYPNALNTDEQLCYLWGYPDEFTYMNAASAAGYIRGNHTLDPDYAEHHPVLCSATIETGRCAGIISGSSTYFNRVAMSFSAVYVEGMVKALGEAVLDMYPNI